ncbi:MAG: hypothetical protein PHH28_02255 [Desulfuromonadaceae bacterium]|nr:hypothetical protein [Desulfuromonadaceae bacterium]
MIIEGNDQRLAAATAAQMQQTGAQQILAPRATQYQDAQKTSNDNTVQPIGGDKVSIKLDLPQNTIDTLQKMGNISDFLNSVATNLRQTYQGLTATSAIVDKMKVSLEKVIKNYPPYPIEDHGRMEELKNYSSLQKQIMQLTVPSPPQPIYEKVKHLWESLAIGPDGSIQTPSVPQNVPEAHVKSAAKQLDFISGQINLVQEAMSSSVRTA